MALPSRRPWTDARASSTRAQTLPPLGAREAQAEVVEAAGGRIEPAAGLDEIQQVVAARRLEEDHALVRKRALEAEDVDVEALGALEIARLEGQVAEAAFHVRATPLTDAPEDEPSRALPLRPTSVV